MVKIKREKKLNLIELLEYIKEKNTSFQTEVFIGLTGGVVKNLNGIINISDADFDGIFPVEVEEEITEDTKINKLFLITSDSNYSEMYYNYSINDILSNNEGYYKELAIVLMNPEPTVIWGNGKLVD